MKKGWYVCILLWVVASLCACVGTKSRQEKAYREQGKKNAQSYIEDKYHFKAKVKEVHPLYKNTSPIPNLNPALNGSVNAVMEHEGKEFHVIISGADQTTKGVDDYQLDEIRTAYRKRLEKAIQHPVYIHTLAFQIEGVEESNMFPKEKVYRGSVDSFFTHMNVFGLFYTIQAKSLSNAQNVLPVNKDTIVGILNFRKEETAASLVNQTDVWTSSDGLGSYQDLQMAYALDLKDSYLSAADMWTYTTYQPEHIQDMLCFSFDEKRRQVPCDLRMEHPKDKQLFADMKKWYTPLSYSDILHLKTDLDTLIYMPEASFPQPVKRTRKGSQVDLFCRETLSNGKISVNAYTDPAYSPKIESILLQEKQNKGIYKKIRLHHEDVYLCYIETLTK